MKSINKTIICILLFLLSPLAQAERVKDISSIAGVRSNQLVGYGLVVGLDGTGDGTRFTKQSLRSMLTQLGITIPPGVDLKIKNVAAVAVSAELHAFAKPGQQIDITVSSIGDAKSLRGGTLLMTPLRGADNQVYAIAQGNVVVGGVSAFGGDGSKVTVNVPSVGRIPNGASVEKSVPNPFYKSRIVYLNLNSPDFTTANRLVNSINNAFGANTAKAVDSATVQVSSNKKISERVQFISLLENLELTPGDGPAKIIVNSRTGTIVIGQHVRVMPAVVSHGSLTVTITETPQVSQPNPLAEGETVVVPESNVSISQENSRAFLFNPGTSLQDIVRSVNLIGAAPGDLIAILEALKQVGALRAKLEVI